MKRFREFIEDDPLAEGIAASVIRDAALLSYASAAKERGNKAEAKFKQAADALSKTDQPPLDRIESALTLVIAGLIDQRHQIGSAVAVSLIGHLLTHKTLRQKTPQKR